MYLKKIIKVCVLVLAMVGALLSLTVPFIAKQNNLTVSAVTLAPADSFSGTTFDGSVMPIYITGFSDNTPSASDVSVVGVANAHSIHLAYKAFNFSVSVASHSSNASFPVEKYFPSFSVSGSSFVFDSWTNLLVSSNSKYFWFSYYCDTGFDSSTVRGVNLFTEARWGSDTNLSSYHLDYFDSTGKFFKAAFCFWSTGVDFNLDDRTYFFTNDFTNNDYYQQGLVDGEQNAIRDYSQDWYNDGLEQGQILGLEEGKIIGRNEANTYTFFNLFGAMFDVPVKFITGFFNFNLLGVNLLGLVTGLLTLSLIIRLIKWISGGK